MIWKKNEALHRSPIASSVYSDNYDLWGPIYATDSLFPASNTDTQFFHSYTEVTPWIRVDLKKILDISFLRVYIRTDTEGTCREFLQFFLASFQYKKILPTSSPLSFVI